MRLIGQPDGRSHLRRRFATRQQPLRFGKPEGHQHLLRRGVMLRLELPQEMERTEARYGSQFVEGEPVRKMLVQIIHHRCESRRTSIHRLAWHARMPTKLAQQLVQQTVERQGFARPP